MLDELHRPVCIDGQRASALRFGDRRVQALFAALLRFDLLPHGFRNRELREAVASLCGLSLDDYGTGRMTYDLRRLRLQGSSSVFPAPVGTSSPPRGAASRWPITGPRRGFSGRCCRRPSTGIRPHGFGKPSPLTTKEVGRAWHGEALAGRTRPLPDA